MAERKLDRPAALGKGEPPDPRAAGRGRSDLPRPLDRRSADLWLIGGCSSRFDVRLLRLADGLSLGIEEDRAAAAAMGFVDDSKGADFWP
jgi:hypothetical protein